MHILVVHLNIKPESVQAHKEAWMENARFSRTEPGIISFDLLQDKEDPSKFVLYEVYVDADGQAAHRQTAHYQKWKETTADMHESPGLRGLYDYAEKVK